METRQGELETWSRPAAWQKRIDGGSPPRSTQMPSLRPARARRLGFEADTDIDEIIRAFIDEELGGRPAI